MNRPSPGSVDRERPAYNSNRNKTAPAREWLTKFARGIDEKFAGAIKAAGSKCRCGEPLRVMAVSVSGAAVIGCRACP
jgi:hypothetical protein